jgi:TonB family protein
MEFSAASALLPKNAKDVEAAALVSSAEAIADEPAEPLAAPAAGKAQALRQEVEALREHAAGVPATAKSASVEHDYVPTELTAAEEALLPKPSLDFTVSLPKGRWTFRASGNFTPGFRGGVLRLAALTATLGFTVFGAAWYKHWIPWGAAKKKPPIFAGAIRENTKASRRLGSQELAKEHPEFTNTNVASDTSTIRPSRPLQAPESPSQPAASSASAVQPAGRNASPPTLAGKRSMARATPKATAEPILSTAEQNVIVPPKLIKSVRAVASLDDLRDFETGNVVIDAVVGTEGEVHFISVISGPPSLRAPAIQAVKQYRYEPAKRNGQAVPEHVNITIRFRFES